MVESCEFPSPPDRDLGLTTAEAAELLREHGANLLVPAEAGGRWWPVVVRSVTDPMTLLLVVAATTYLLLGETVDAVAALVALAPIVGVGVVLERRAERALDELAALTAPVARVWRDRKWVTVAASEVVAGDLVGLQEGDIAPADGRLVPGWAVVMDESSLTGESQSVVKDQADDRIWAGTTTLSGRAFLTVVATGTGTRYGQIGHLVAETRGSRTPLEESIRRLVLRLGVVAVVFALLVALVALTRGGTWGEAVIAGVSLGMAAIPEEFPLVFTLYLALGARRIARHRALVRRLTAVETLGSTTVICTDKTGTLTLGSLSVAEVMPAPGSEAVDVLEAGVLASEVDPFDPLDKAIVEQALAMGVDVAGLHSGSLVADFDFDTHSRSVTHVWAEGGRFIVAGKGALEGLLEVVEAPAAVVDWAEEAMEALGAAGVRVIGVARGSMDRSPGDRKEAEAVLGLVGLIGFTDPTRPEVPSAIEECHRAGVRIVMITGDHPVTARSVADGLGFPGERVVTGDELEQAPDPMELVSGASVFARVLPEQKHRLVSALKARGETVAMTGDGINDAPALKEADIGVAMGLRGTAVARESATLVLLDDNFATIVEAVREGRRIYANLRNAFSYLVAFHVPLLVLALLMPLLGKPLLLLPFHLIALEFLLHPIVALAFEQDPAAPGIMNAPPRPRGEGLGGRRLLGPALRGSCLAVASAAIYLLAPAGSARGTALACLFVGEIMLVLTERNGRRPGRNPVLVPLLVAALVVVSLLFLVPPLRRAMAIDALSVSDWAVAVGAAGLATLWGLFTPRARRSSSASEREHDAPPGRG